MTKPISAPLSREQIMLYTPINELNFTGALDAESSCCFVQCMTKICQVMKKIVFCLCGSYWFNDDRVSLQQEEKSISAYQTALTRLVVTIANSTLNKDIGTSIDAFYAAFRERCLQISVLRPDTTAEGLYSKNLIAAALSDCASGLATYSDFNETAVTAWNDFLKAQINHLHTNYVQGDGCTLYMENCAKKFTPEFLEKHGLASLKQFGESYVGLYGVHGFSPDLDFPPTRRNLERAAVILLRDEIAKEYGTAYLEKIGKLSTENRRVKPYVYFTLRDLCFDGAKDNHEEIFADFVFSAYPLDENGKSLVSDKIT